ncbi:MAG: exodeoxyribonuclease III [Oscillospiraceae bacterium]|jgi:exodeoxyribonuclease-3|nr:exodeoxyribonuclease III [Oscillospiraceae bacterium]
MKLVSWNVNGLRACLGKGFLESFRALDADVFALQETKMMPGQAEIDLPGYAEHWNAARKKGYSGTAVFTRVPPLSAATDMGVAEHDEEGRIITLEFPSFFFVNVYTPNSQRDLARLPYRMRWEDDFKAFLCDLDTRKPVVVCGDLNCAHREIDLKHPTANRRNAGFTDEERAKLTALLEAGFADTFRALYPDRRDAYTWWSYFSQARTRNVGWRIDYFLVSRRLLSHVREAAIHPDIHGSDHCPVSLIIDN